MESIKVPLERLQGQIGWMEKERARLIRRYLSLLQDCLCGVIYEDPPLKVLGTEDFDAELREYGWDWPSVAHTMIGKKRLANLCALTESILGEGIEGDFIETGVWRGGACILVRGVLDAYCIKDRNVWLADSFEGLPPPDLEKYPADKGDIFHTFSELSISQEQVERNFEKYGLLDGQVKFLKGWFKDTLPNAPIKKLALLRLDGDMYESTMDALVALYDKLSVGGYVIIDDYHVVEGCKNAVNDFLNRQGLSPEIEEIDGVGVYWRKALTASPSQLNKDNESVRSEVAACLDIPWLAQIDNAYTEIANELSESRDILVVLDQELIQSKAVCDGLVKQLEQQRKLQEELHQSTSWRLTKPVRFVGRILKNRV
jgi:O-methyltransferase